MEAPQESIDGLINAFAKNIHKGYKVYQIQFIIDRNKNYYNVFIDPKTKQILAENNEFILPRSTKVK